jgi:outer membrane protein assembly factor BamB/tetratricopeptide (TPR) repeat protein
MEIACRRRMAARWGAIWVFLGSFLLATAPESAVAQPPQFELSDKVHLDEADSATQAHLERVRAFIADGQWDEAVETLRRLLEAPGNKVVPVTPGRYVNLADYCQLQISALPTDALELYRDRVDPLAKKWFEEAIATADAERLRAIVDQMLCSHWGDDALWTLGEIELERGHHAAARGYWERLVQQPPTRIDADRFRYATEQAGLPAADFELLTKWYQRDPTIEPPIFRLRTDRSLDDVTAAALVRIWTMLQTPGTRLSYPATSIPLAEIRARLVLVSILEGNLARAKAELAAFRQLHPEATGHLAGRTTNLAEGLTTLITAAEKWPAEPPLVDWPTFAGNFARNGRALAAKELSGRAWPAIDFGEVVTADVANTRAFSYKRVGEDAGALLSYHPTIVDNLVLFSNHRYVFAFDLQTGRPAWPGDANIPLGAIYDNETLESQPIRTHRGLGVPRYTLTVHGQKLYALLGSQLTSRTMESFERQTGYLVCLDLAAQGRLVWKLTPEDDRWAYEGPPVVDGANVYVAMRRSDVRPQVFVACLDAETGRQQWRTMICSAEAPSGGQSDEITHNLLTLNEGMLYLNTNLGAVAALAAHDGRVQWISLYPRARKASLDGVDKRATHFYRDLNPCVYQQGLVYAAPSDCESIFALDAATGQIAWESHLPGDVVHLLGVADGKLVGSGERLWWIDAAGGKVLARWPDTTPLGYGRGVIAGDTILWTTRESLFTLDLALSKERLPVMRRGAVALTTTYGATGGNLVSARDKLLIASASKLFAFNLTTPKSEPRNPKPN